MKPFKASGSSMARSISSIKHPCAGCKLLRRRCNPDCIFVPYFPSNVPEKFASVHKIFGASNVSKMLHDIGEDQREDAVSSLVYEANARLKDPVYGCVGTISYLQNQVTRLQSELAMALAETIMLRSQLSEALCALACAQNSALSETIFDDPPLFGQPLSTHNHFGSFPDHCP